MADRVAVMYAGEIVEYADAEPVFAHPLHPYTQGLIGSIPVLGKVVDRLEVIPGLVPNLIDLPPGCRFAPRCILQRKIRAKDLRTEKPAPGGGETGPQGALLVVCGCRRTYRSD